MESNCYFFRKTLTLVLRNATFLSKVMIIISKTITTDQNLLAFDNFFGIFQFCIVYFSLNWFKLVARSRHTRYFLCIFPPILKHFHPSVFCVECGKKDPYFHPAVAIWVIPCQINQWFASHPSDFDEIWHICR